MQTSRHLLRPLGGVVFLAVAFWRFGSGAVVDALRGIDGSALALAAAFAALTTVCGAWRWVLVARGLGADLSLRSAVAESYRSQFLNVTLPGGVVGDVRRGVRHGRAAGDLGRGLRAVVWERAAGQAVLAVLAVGALVLVPWVFRPGARAPVSAGTSAVAVVAAVAVVGAVTALLLSRGRGRARRLVRLVAADLRVGVLSRRTWPGVVAASVLVVAGHVATFVVAARTAGVTAPSPSLLPLALLVLVAMGLPLNVAGWGPREGAAAWLFGAAGLGTTAGMGTAVVYGVLVLVASLPGAALLFVSHRTTRRGGSPDRCVAPAEPVVDLEADVEADVEGAARG
ncbi:lysylphosphatidylglycerol synthase transmembrane domain-containing protein [Terrabacter terrigena]|uniref:Lysylphosphatidylglycerol synthase transmembrane domain-containing protein n=1 Tax=Terrabacter terrigena TaxID=574718 RepID=A0ABW3MUH0_9MICO